MFFHISFLFEEEEKAETNVSDRRRRIHFSSFVHRKIIFITSIQFLTGEKSEEEEEEKGIGNLHFLLLADYLFKSGKKEKDTHADRRRKK